MSKKQQLWYFLIEGRTDSTIGFFKNYYTFGTHLGDALQKSMNTLKDASDLTLIEALPLKSLEVVGNHTELIAIDTDVYIRPSQITYKVEENEIDFIAPNGIVKSSNESDYELEQIKEKYEIFEEDEEGILELDLVVSKPRLLDTFFSCIDLLPSVDRVDIYINNNWDNGLTELWISNQYSNTDDLKIFLFAQRTDTIDNGFLDIVVHSIIGESNLTLNSFKKIQFHTQNTKMFQQFVDGINKLGFEQTDELLSLEFDFNHYHYRLGESMTKHHFLQMLTLNKFELIDKWKE